MATIIEKSGSFCVQIRKKTKNLYASFDNENDAKLWARYKEDLIDQIETFEPPLSELVTLNEAIDMKVKASIENKLDKRSIQDMNKLKDYFSDMLSLTLNEISYESLLEKSVVFMNTVVRHGGSKKDISTGSHRFPSQETVLNRFRLLAGVFSHVINLGIPVNNSAMQVSNYLRVNKTKTQ